MQVKKNQTTSYTPDMSEQENKENIIRMSEQIRSLSDKMDDFIMEVRRGFSEIKDESKSMELRYSATEARYATKDEVGELKRSHQSLVRYLMGIVITIVTVVIVGVMALLGLNQ